MKNFFELSGKVALVTGGYGYLGASMCHALQSYGAKVFVGGRSSDKFQEVFNGDDSISFVELDISNPESFTAAFTQVKTEAGSLDILVNNAYYGAAAPPEELTSEDWRTGIDGSLNSTFDAIKAAIPFMKESGGKIINISSMYGVEVPDLAVYNGREEFLNPPNYGTAKAAVLHLTKYYAMVLGKYNIQVNAISPGPFPNEAVKRDEGFIKRLENKTVAKRIGEPEDLSGALLLLASQASNYITGHNLVVDGGWTI